ncbi:class I SAM-dependent methyltransferase [Roseimaritima ulvae]|uniref:Bifunctional 3-demethylubiquinone-9 3-methyltransferase/ 2-octaprenyl-6-hydroxy phenol methylase n=1 Tax=Roseimaritima ulvae TaxID=980254 RepID=A0A5B9R8E3_9BACT|nr:class I SAM-dependent methyltransferase [Roseimaritima ulvae]QEG43051.1 bifunctional 3-demethylubiquinone-9 3-methyltransferase/ 2-octaprenyl-6-hydroxy phenol methylase [Roseimaritima ulvae]
MTDNGNKRQSLHCRICRNEAGTRYTVREMMFGSRLTFPYFQCAACGCLQLIEPPADPAAHYPSGGYYAYDAQPPLLPATTAGRQWLKRRRDAAILFRRGRIFSCLARRYPNPGIADLAAMLGHHPRAHYNMQILDVGCGSGALLQRLHDLGFQSLTGVDPYLGESRTSGAVRLLADRFDSLPPQRYDLIMMHHAFEHMESPRRVLRQVHSRLRPSGQCYIRIPIVSRGPWKTFGVDWAEIDAPRHYFLHSERSMQILAESAGLKIVHIAYESEAFTYAASELYRRDIPLNDPQQSEPTPLESRFEQAEWQAFEQAAQRDLRPGWAGRAAFTLALASAPLASVEIPDPPTDTASDKRTQQG